MSHEVWDVLVVGAGEAGATCARELHARGVRVAVIEPRETTVELPPLSKSLFAEELTLTEHRLPAEVPVIRDRVVEMGRVVEMDEDAVRLASGAEVVARDIVLAVGARARDLDEELPGSTSRSGSTLHTAADALALRGRIAVAESIGIVGSGFLALELARGAVEAGKRATVHLKGELPLTGLHPRSSRTLMDLHAAAGVHFVPEAAPGDRLPHDLWLVAVGARAADLGGVEVDEFLRVRRGGETLEHLHAIGDCARIVSGPMSDPGRFESEPMATSQGTWLAEHLAAAHLGTDRAGDELSSNPWVDVPWHWSFQGPVRVFTAGRAASACSPVPVVLGDPAGGKGQVLLFEGDEDHARLCGVETLGLPPAHNHARKVLAGPRVPTRKDALEDGFSLKSWARVNGSTGRFA